LDPTPTNAAQARGIASVNPIKVTRFLRPRKFIALKGVSIQTKEATAGTSETTEAITKASTESGQTVAENTIKGQCHRYIE
jgi:hypothetical protein